jgi:lipopolysaccharide/colanic/teichoic acid biosynthesis glycosyltransferase
MIRFVKYISAYIYIDWKTRCILLNMAITILFCLPLTNILCYKARMALRGIEYLQSDSKRRLDLIGGIALADALTSTALVSAAASMAASQSFRPLFTQRRVGQRGKEFDIYKLRSLPDSKVDHDKNTYRALGTFDPRANIIGLMLRGSGLDEIPQLWNVIKGDLSLVGPRPVVNTELEIFEDIDPTLFNEWHAMRNSTKPGLFGPSQLFRHNYRYNTDEMYRTSMQIDLEYAANATLMKDIRLLGAFPLHIIQANIGVIDNALEVSKSN